MKVYEMYERLKRKSVELLSKGLFNEYFDTLMTLSKLEKQMIEMTRLN